LVRIASATWARKRLLQARYLLLGHAVVGQVEGDLAAGVDQHPDLGPGRCWS
jgi:hypothetical protein